MRFESHTRKQILESLDACTTVSTARKIEKKLRHRDKIWDTFVSNKLLQTYGKLGCIESATRVFQAIAHKDAFSWRLMLAACCHSGDVAHAWQLFHAMPPPHRCHVAWTVMLTGYARGGHLHEARQLFDEMPCHDLVSWSSMLDAYSQNNHAGESAALFESMPEWDVVSSTCMLRAYARDGHREESKRVFDEMVEQNLVAWTILLDLYAQHGRTRDSMLVFERMPEHDVVSSTAMICAYAREGHVDLALEVFARMPVRDIASWNAMLCVYSSASCDHQQYRVNREKIYLDDARFFFDSMPFHNVVSSTAMLQAYSQRGHVHQAAKIYRSIPRKDVVSTTAMIAAFAQNGHWIAMLAAYSQIGDFARAKDLFDAMPGSSAMAWRALIAATTAHPNEAIQALHRMQSLGEYPDPSFFVPLLASCCHAGKLKPGIRFFASMSRDFDLEPCKQHYSCLIGLLARSGHLEDAADLLASMPFVPDALDWRCFLGASRFFDRGPRDHGAFATSSILELEPKDSAAYLLVLNYGRTVSHSTSGLTGPKRTVMDPTAARAG